MPIGSTELPQGYGDPTTPRVPVGGMPASELVGQAPVTAPLPQQLGHGAVDLWHHVTITVDELNEGDEIRVDLEVEVTALEILAVDTIELYVGLNRNVGAFPGQYDVKHPGGGELVKRIPPTRFLTIVAGGGWTQPVELYAYAGSYAAGVV